jgi:hypothetical protein
MIMVEFVKDVDFVYRFLGIYDFNSGEFGKRWS